MIKVTVKINGREYNLKGNDNEQYLKDVSSFVDGKIKQIKANNGVLSSVDASVLAAINIADELYRTDSEADELSKRNKIAEERSQKLEEEAKRLRERCEVLLVEKEGYDDFMLKEIYEQPISIRETIGAKLNEEKIYFPFEMGDQTTIAENQRVSKIKLKKIRGKKKQKKKI